jgi:Fe-S-cluster containining protein
MNSAIEGPNCIDPQTCKGDCCSIKIDVPKVLANEYIRRSYADINDFVRSNVFSFQLRFDEKTGKCFLFDKEINGCSIHDSGIKPPQCWIYPTGFSNPDGKPIRCKRVAGWSIKDIQKAKQAGDLLKTYIFLCKIEAKKELRYIQKRLNDSDKKISKSSLYSIKKELKKIPPSGLGGFKDLWENIGILPAEGFSLQMKKFCVQTNKNCQFLEDNFIKCPNICETIANKLVEFLQENLAVYVKKKNADVSGEYPLYKLFSFKNLYVY